MRNPARSLAAVFVPVIAFLLTGVAHSVPAQEAIPNAPPNRTKAQFIEKARRLHDLNSARSGLEITKDPSTVAEVTDLRWGIQDAVNRGQAVQGLEAFGVKQLEDGSVEIDIQNHPYWLPFHERAVMLETPSVLNGLAPMLLDRGFREEDLARMKAYLETHSFERDQHWATRPEVESFAKRLQSPKTKQLPLSEAKAFRYRLKQVSEQSKRKWAEGLLNVLDPQRQRILVSLLEETAASFVIAPDPDPDAMLKEEMARMRSPTFMEMLRQQDQEFTQ